MPADIKTTTIRPQQDILVHATAGVDASQFSVFANGIAVVRPGDKLQPHTILKNALAKNVFVCPIELQVNSGSGSVFAQGIPVARVW